MAKSSIQVSKVWPVEKYARFVSSSAPTAGGEGRKEGVWQVTGMVCIRVVMQLRFTLLLFLLIALQL